MKKSEIFHRASHLCKFVAATVSYLWVYSTIYHTVRVEVYILWDDSKNHSSIQTSGEYSGGGRTEAEGQAVLAMVS